MLAILNVISGAPFKEYNAIKNDFCQPGLNGGLRPQDDYFVGGYRAFSYWLLDGGLPGTQDCPPGSTKGNEVGRGSWCHRLIRLAILSGRLGEEIFIQPSLDGGEGLRYNLDIGCF